MMISMTNSTFRELTDIEHSIRKDLIPRLQEMVLQKQHTRYADLGTGFEQISLYEQGERDYKVTYIWRDNRYSFTYDRKEVEV